MTTKKFEEAGMKTKWLLFSIERWRFFRKFTSRSTVQRYYGSRTNCPSQRNDSPLQRPYTERAPIET